MDKRSVFGFILIGIVLMIWLYWNSSNQQKISQKNRTADSLMRSEQLQKEMKESINKPDSLIGGKQQTDSLKNDSLLLKYGNLFFTKSIGYPSLPSEKVIILENDIVKMEFTNYGGSLREYTIKNYTTWDNKPLQLVDWKAGKELHLLFTSKEGKLINTKNLVFNSDYPEWKKVDLNSDNSFKLEYSLTIPGDSIAGLKKIYTFYKDKYEFDVEYQFTEPVKFISDNKYQVVWETSLNMTEFRSDQEITFSEAFAHMGGELETLDAADETENYKEDFNGNTDYVSLRTKYFGLFIIPNNMKGDGAYLAGYKELLKDKGARENYSIAVKMNLKDDKSDKTSFKILIAPLDYSILKSYSLELEKTLRFSLDFIVRPIAQYVIIPVFLLIHTVVPSWGLVIIIFALLMKIVLNPLTKSQMNSMKKMAQLNPKITSIREKYKDDPVKANQQIMKIYKEEKINPAGGCLPMLIQLPILYALFGVFNSTIELRHASFLWISDLSSPDVIAKLPFKIPIFGIDQISLLAILMGVTMFIQQKMTMTDPKQKALVYIMPVMLTLLFFSFPAGLNLYYFMFNLFSIAQQWYTNRKNPPAKTEVLSVVKKPQQNGKNTIPKQIQSQKSKRN